MQLSSSPELDLRFFGFLLINASLKLHYKSKSISAHKGEQLLPLKLQSICHFTGGLALFKLTIHPFLSTLI